MLDRLAQDSETGVRRAVAKNPYSPSSALEKVSLDSYLVSEVANNPNTSGNVLAKLAKEDGMSVAQNPSTPANVLEELFMGWMKTYVLRNPSAPTPLLAWAAGSPFPPDRYAILCNPSTPRTALDYMAGDENALDKEAIASYMLHSRIMDIAKDDSDDYEQRTHYSFRLKLADNPCTPVQILESLSLSSDIGIRLNLAGQSVYAIAISRVSSWRLR